MLLPSPPQLFLFSMGCMLAAARLASQRQSNRCINKREMFVEKNKARKKEKVKKKVKQKGHAALHAEVSALRFGIHPCQRLLASAASIVELQCCTCTLHILCLTPENCPSCHSLGAAAEPQNWTPWRHESHPSGPI
jgi:hypothetical protein